MKTKYALLSLLFCLMCAYSFAETVPNNTVAQANTLALNGSNTSAISQMIDVSKFSAGIYIVQMINTNHAVITKKLVIANK